MFLHSELSYSSLRNQELVRGCSWHTDPGEPRAPLTQEAPEDRRSDSFQEHVAEPQMWQQHRTGSSHLQKGKVSGHSIYRSLGN